MRIKRKRHDLALVEVQYRAVITKICPDKEEFTSCEGPYAKDHQAQARITFWKNHFGQDPEKAGWSVDGHVEHCVMDWKS